MDIEIVKEEKDEHGRVVRLEYYKNDAKYREYREKRKKRAKITFLIIASIFTAIMFISLIFLILHTIT